MADGVNGSGPKEEPKVLHILTVIEFEDHNVTVQWRGPSFLMLEKMGTHAAEEIKKVREKANQPMIVPPPPGIVR